MPTVINNIEKQQFEINLGDEIAYLSYRFYKKDIALMHTLVPEAFKGQGLATALAEFAFAYAKSQNKPVMVYCPFVSRYVKDHPEVRVQLDKAYHSG
ncbi:GNAT family N-acetyltransferase [Pedobacter montanisoli]|uniref:N-acetyltransferase n=1 Tax=Pedobacter montanisoli TaxID=2923277 RepID=A0ABS9ZS17_9SPHI|nr:GNAT family N-acetyltransferase [Pedobacter montanisoli]MCJ0741379.1 N-acetyltransferase [Pedobacter montanisoli]